MIYTVPKDWPGETCVIVAGGPSLRTFDPKTITGVKPRPRIVAINDSWQLVPSADVCYFGDWHWWQDQQARNPRTKEGDLGFHDMIYKKLWVTIARQFWDHPQVRCLRTTGQQGLEENAVALRDGCNSGYAAINLAYHFGAARIILLGYDMQCHGHQTHWHNAPRWNATAFSATLRNSMLPHFATLVEPLARAGVAVINATPDSALTCWPNMPLEEALIWKA